MLFPCIFTLRIRHSSRSINGSQRLECHSSWNMVSVREILSIQQGEAVNLFGYSHDQLAWPDLVGLARVWGKYAAQKIRGGGWIALPNVTATRINIWKSFSLKIRRSLHLMVIGWSVGNLMLNNCEMSGPAWEERKIRTVHNFLCSIRRRFHSKATFRNEMNMTLLIFCQPP